jgi:hypothetical protein
LNGTFVVFEYKQMTIYRTRYRDPKQHSWISQWSPTHAVAELRRIEVEKRLAPKKVEIQVERFEVNLGKDAIIKSLMSMLRSDTRDTRDVLALIALRTDSIGCRRRRFVSDGAPAFVLIIGARRAGNRSLSSAWYGSLRISKC